MSTKNMAAIEREVFKKLENFERLPEFLHECVNNLSKLTNVSDSNTSSDIAWTREELKTARVQIQNIFRQIAMDENFSLPNDFPENVRTALTNVYKIRQKDILNLLVKENLLHNGHNLVENIDWKLKWILGSSNLATIREPVCQIDLRCISAEKDSTIFKRDVNFECNLVQIDELISVLTKVKNDLDGL